MPSILSRLRTRPSSQSSRQSAQPVLSAPAAPITAMTPTDIKRAVREEPIHEASTQESAPMARKIFPDIDRLPDDFAAEPMSTRHGLPPPVRRGLSGSNNLPRSDASSAPTAANGDSDSPKESHSSSSLGNTTPSRRGFMERLGNWSTFGRSRAPPPSLNEFGEQVSPSAWRTRRTNSRRSSRMTSSMYSSPENKENAPRLSSQSSLGRRTPLAAATRSNTPRPISTSVGRELGFDSPRTLGHPSPEVIASSASQTPLPALDHSGLHSRSRTATFPPHAWSARAKNKGRITANQFTFGKSLRPYRSLPRVQHIFRTRSNKSVEEGNEQREGDAVVDDAEGDQGNVPVPTVASWPSPRPIGLSQLLGPPSSSTSSSSSSPSPNPIANFTPGGLVHAHDPKAHNLYDPNISLFDNVVGMPQDAPRVRDQKPLRSSLKASARPSPTPIASSSSPDTGASGLMPSFSLVAAVATASDTALHQTPLSSPDRSETAKGKRKAEDVEITPPDSKKATFAVPASPRDHIPSLAPSSFHNNKRARLSGPSPSPAPPNTNAQNTGTYSSRTSSRARPPSSTRSGPHDNASERERRRSMSQRSIPISALVTPQVPSVGRPSSAYHMRDPRRPPRRMETGWALRFRTTEEEGSSFQAWLFYPGLVLFPLWWIGAVWRVPQTRVVGGSDTEKAVPLDDPQIEFDARSWRFRCRVMAVISLFTYIPFIVCIAIFAGR